MNSLSDEAIIIGLMDYREADKLVTLFTKEHGKIRGVAKGAKRSQKRFGGALELFAKLTVRFIHHEGLSTIQDCDILTIFPNIRYNLEKITMSGYGAELIDLLSAEECPNQRLFRLFSSYLEYLDSSVFDISDRRFFEINLLNILGYRLPIEHCPKCGRNLAEYGAEWITGNQFIVSCKECSVGGKSLSPLTIKLMQQSLKTGHFGTIRFVGSGIDEAGELIDVTIASNIQRPLRSLEFIKLYS
ncbi:MAG: DNA repair protein RecO [Desulfuromonadales bacterium]|nr:DNA repair protein RecO [Desulfuromonadales bacterium]